MGTPYQYGTRGQLYRFEMWDENVFHCSNLNDDFYLISVDKRKNIVAYNKKMFEILTSVILYIQKRTIKR